MEKWTFHYLKQTCSVSGKVTSFVMQLKNGIYNIVSNNWANVNV